MSESTKIEWCDHTFNPWIGCTKVSPGCAHCYAESQDKFRSWTPDGWGPGKPRRRTSAANWKAPIKWNAAARGTTTRPRVFCASLADVLDEEVPIDWLVDLLDLIRNTPHLDWLLLTKRPHLFKLRVGSIFGDGYQGATEGLPQWVGDWLDGSPPPNVWLGTSVEDQKRADERIPALLKIPARVRFLSCEPLLERVALGIGDPKHRVAESYHAEIDWVIVGGESGPNRRTFDLEAGHDLILQCRRSRIAVFMKQMGELPVSSNVNLYDFDDDTGMEPWGEGFASCRIRFKDRKGGDMAEWPPEFQIREFPKGGAS